MNRKHLIVLAIVAILATITIVSATIVYTLSISNSMKLNVENNLQLRRFDGTTVITSYTWGDFDESQGKTMYDETLQLHNLGNALVNVNIDVNVDMTVLGWELKITDADKSRVLYNNMATIDVEFQIETGAYIPIIIYLREYNATAGLSSAFDIAFNVIEP